MEEIKARREMFKKLLKLDNKQLKEALDQMTITPKKKL